MMSAEVHTDSHVAPANPTQTPGIPTSSGLAAHEEWLSRMAQTCEQAARGNLNVRLLNIDVDPDTDLGRALHAVNAQLDYMEAFVREVKAVLACAAEGKHFRRVPLPGMLRDFRLAVESINAAAGEMQAKTEQIEQAKAQRLAVASEFERTVETVIGSVSVTAEDLQTTSRQLAEAATTTSTESDSALESSLQSVDRVRHVAAMTSQMNDAIEQIDAMAHECNEISAQAVEEVEQATEVMTQLDQSSRSIDNVVENIMDIAKQTQLLSLNAAIEAARAGTAGAGFAIVANEIQKLAERTREATESAKRDIHHVQSAAENAVSSIRRFGVTIGELHTRSDAISGLTEQQQEVAGAIRHDVEAANQDAESVKSSIEVASSAATETAAASSQLLGLSNDLSQQAKSLSEGVEQVLVQIRSDSTAPRSDS